MLTTLKTRTLCILHRRPVVFMLLFLAALWSSAGILLWRTFF
ncbi:hypothetical protein [Serratia marcescens]|nr:hypothetical protein [Serratia marcescens]